MARASGLATEKTPFTVGMADDMAVEVDAPGNLAAGVKKQIHWLNRSAQSPAQSIKHAVAIMARQPVIGHGDQQIGVGIGPGRAPRPGTKQPHFSAGNHGLDLTGHGGELILDRCHLGGGGCGVSGERLSHWAILGQLGQSLVGLARELEGEPGRQPKPELGCRSQDAGLACPASAELAGWLIQQQLSLAFTTYRAKRLPFLGVGVAGELRRHERLFDPPMGLYAHGEVLWMATRRPICHLNGLALQHHRTAA